MQGIWVQSLGQEDQLEKIFLSGKFHGQRSLEDYSLWGNRSQTRFSDYTTTTIKRLTMTLIEITANLHINLRKIGIFTMFSSIP